MPGSRRDPMSGRHVELQRRTVDMGATIFREGDDPRGEAFLVHAGRVEVRRRADGRDYPVRVLGKGDLLGELALFRGTAHSASPVAIEPVTLLVIPARQLYGLVLTRPRLAVALIRQLATRLREAESRTTPSL